MQLVDISASLTSNDCARHQTSKYDFYFRHAARCDRWLRQHGFIGLRRCPNEFEAQSQNLPRPSSGTLQKATLNRDFISPRPGSQPTLAQLIESETQKFKMQSGTSVQQHHQPQPLPQYKTIDNNANFGEDNRKLRAPLCVLARNNSNNNNNYHNNTPIVCEQLDEEYLRAVEINRRHIAERDGGSSVEWNRKNAGGNNWSQNQLTQARSVPPKPQVHYVDYTQTESYVTRSSAPNHFHRDSGAGASSYHIPKQHQGSQQQQQQQQQNHHYQQQSNYAKTFTSSSSSSSSSCKPAAPAVKPLDDPNSSSSKKFVKRFHKNPNNNNNNNKQEQMPQQRKGAIIGWQEQLREQERNRLRGEGYDRLYGRPSLAQHNHNNQHNHQQQHSHGNNSQHHNQPQHQPHHHHHHHHQHNQSQPHHHHHHHQRQHDAMRVKETNLQASFDRFCDKAQPKFWPQLPVRIHFSQ